MVLAPCRQVSQEAAVCVRSINAGMSAHLLEINGVNAPFAAIFHVRQPPLELQEPHPAALESLWLERLRATCDRAVAEHRPPGRRTEV